MAVHDIEADEQRNAEPRFLDGQALHFAHMRCADHVEQIADGAALIASVESPAMTGPVTA